MRRSFLKNSRSRELYKYRFRGEKGFVLIRGLSSSCLGWGWKVEDFFRRGVVLGFFC